MNIQANNQKVVQLARYIEAHADESLPLSRLADESGLSAAYLQKIFKACVGVSPKQFQDAIRQQRFKGYLKQGQSVTDAIFESGYGSVSRIYDKAVRGLGMTPSQYKQGAANEHIYFTSGKTPVGLLMIAATDAGVCFAMFGTNQRELKKNLQEEFPHAKLQSSAADQSQALQNWFDAINVHLSDGAPQPDIPLDIRGTVFQIKVWTFLKHIPDGHTVSYKEVAQGIGQPNAIRAAASACAKNRIALLIPCHRVLRGDGAMGGFRWGVERKEALLQLENKKGSNSRA
jgi:AraC family transcriptional regulator of adaptative response/methylated-DNA-[protein]-cysteine methyltransferase